VVTVAPAAEATVIFAPGSRAPVGSATCPWMEAVEAAGFCAKRTCSSLTNYEFLCAPARSSPPLAISDPSGTGIPAGHSQPAASTSPNALLALNEIFPSCNSLS
jgi:hypothetical protein